MGFPAQLDRRRNPIHEAEAAIAAEHARRRRKQWDTAIEEACAANEPYLNKYGSASDLLHAHPQTERGNDESE